MTEPLDAPSPLQTQTIGPYTIQTELGRNREGGRITYLGLNPNNQQPVVLKQFRFVQTDSSWSGFKSHEREIDILRSIRHPQVPRYLDSFETDDGFCMVQEYKNAPTLGERTHLTPKQVQGVAIKLLKILSDLQQQLPPIIHRDIKPENILVDQNLEVYLIDFGLAKLNHDAIAPSSVAAGTPGFMPPEEIFNRPLDTAADLYSVGATLISLLSHKSSTEISDLIDETYRFNFISHFPPINLAFVEWLTKMVEPNPKDRYSDAHSALQALQNIDISDLTVSPQHNFADKTKNKSAINIATGVLALIGLGLFGMAQFNSQTQTDVQAPANKRRIPTEKDWFNAIKPRCNSLEVITAIQSNPYPATATGIGYGASCYALAGKLDKADETLQSAPINSQQYAASVLFQVGHPVADRGDDESAGPIMDLVVKYWPQNYMAQYHAGISANVLADNEKAKQHLNNFLKTYQNEDGWTATAKLALQNMEQGVIADERFKVHH